MYATKQTSEGNSFGNGLYALACNGLKSCYIMFKPLLAKLIEEILLILAKAVKARPRYLVKDSI